MHRRPRKRQLEEAFESLNLSQDITNPLSPPPSALYGHTTFGSAFLPIPKRHYGDVDRELHLRLETLSISPIEPSAAPASTPISFDDSIDDEEDTTRRISATIGVGRGRPTSSGSPIRQRRRRRTPKDSSTSDSLPISSRLRSKKALSPVRQRQHRTPFYRVSSPQRSSSVSSTSSSSTAPIGRPSTPSSAVRRSSGDYNALGMQDSYGSPTRFRGPGMTMLARRTAMEVVDGQITIQNLPPLASPASTPNASNVMEPSTSTPSAAPQTESQTQEKHTPSPRSHSSPPQSRPDVTAKLSRAPSPPPALRPKSDASMDVVLRGRTGSAPSSSLVISMDDDGDADDEGCDDDVKVVWSPMSRKKGAPTRTLGVMKSGEDVMMDTEFCDAPLTAHPPAFFSLAAEKNGGFDVPDSVLSSYPFDAPGIGNWEDFDMDQGDGDLYGEERRRKGKLPLFTIHAPQETKIPSFILRTSTPFPNPLINIAPDRAQLILYRPLPMPASIDNIKSTTTSPKPSTNSPPHTRRTHRIDGNEGDNDGEGGRRHHHHHHHMHPIRPPISAMDLD
ncbi:hypothetical protein HDU97_003380 [Phlyctochytrium planicorne]|nr:hypothetical protein HDU97_003380 [Phlyctochytrium planicorne]